MKPPPLVHHVPTTLAAALDLLGGLEDAKILAGGQSLVPLLNFRLARPAHLVDVSRLPDLGRIHERDGGVAVGALVTQSAAESDPLLRSRSPLVPLALREVAHPVIRNRGTVVGSLAHGDPAAELGAVLLALGGTVVATSRRGTREIAADRFFVASLETALEPDELVTEAWFPAFTGPVAVLEECRRHGDFALAGVALAGERMAAFGVAETPVLVDPEHPARDLSPSGDGEASGPFVLHLLEVLAGRARAFLGAGGGEVSFPSRSGPRPPAVPAGAFGLNGAIRPAPAAGRRLLSDHLRHDLGLTGTHVGCEHGVCGCCTVLLDGLPVRSCLMLAAQAEGHQVTTVEGLAGDGPLHPVQRAFRECGGLQCGFCTPGFLMVAAALLAGNPHPSAEDIEEAIAGNLCRCTGYAGIRRALGRAAELAGAAG
ncbi:MAG: FAD binding domain-containing protein [Candidatus Dormibacteraceae bacterium]